MMSFKSALFNLIYWGNQMAYIRNCNHCGRCCHTTPCDVALAFVIDAVENYPCPAIEREGDIYLCGVVRSPNKYIDVVNFDRARLDDETISELKTHYLEHIVEKIKKAFVDQCDSYFGTRKKDKRIPIHLL